MWHTEYQASNLFSQQSIRLDKTYWWLHCTCIYCPHAYLFGPVVQWSLHSCLDTQCRNMVVQVLHLKHQLYLLYLQLQGLHWGTHRGDGKPALLRLFCTQGHGMYFIIRTWSFIYCAITLSVLYYHYYGFIKHQFHGTHAQRHFARRISI